MATSRAPSQITFWLVVAIALSWLCVQIQSASCAEQQCAQPEEGSEVADKHLQLLQVAKGKASSDVDASKGQKDWVDVHGAQHAKVARHGSSKHESDTQPSRKPKEQASLAQKTAKSCSGSS